MNEVSFRKDILNEIDEVVTESFTDVLFSLLDASEKAMVILENCTDEDDIWKYSVWQEADENKGEEIDKDKHPFKESSTLKTILMLPINLIKLIFKTISQALSPQKAEESSKLAAVAEKSKSVAQKILPFFFTAEGELNLPVVIATGAAGGGLTIDAIIRKNHSLVVKAVNAVINTWTKIIRRLKGMGVDSVPEKFEFTANKSDPEKFDVSLDFEKAEAYIDAMKKLIDELSGKIESIKNTTDEKKKEAAANDLRKELLAVTRTCPIYRGVKTYTSKEIADFYAKVTGKAKQLDQAEIDKFINAYKPIADGSTDKHTKAVASGISNTFAVFNAFLAAVSSIKTANDTINRVIVQASEYNEIPKADSAPDGFPNGYYMLDDTGKMVPAGDWNKDTAYFTKLSETPAEQGDQNTQDEYEEVTITDGKNPDGFPNGYFTKGADGKYVAVDASTTQIDPNTKYYKKKETAPPANQTGNNQNGTGGTPGEPNAQETGTPAQQNAGNGAGPDMDDYEDNMEPAVNESTVEQISDNDTPIDPSVSAWYSK